MQSPGTAVVVAKDGDKVVGASTCLPLKDEMACIRAPFEERGLSTDDFFYFGESVLLESYRGQGIGVRFFEERERHARSASNASFAVFCAVRRWKTDRSSSSPISGIVLLATVLVCSLLMLMEHLALLPSVFAADNHHLAIAFAMVILSAIVAAASISNDNLQDRSSVHNPQYLGPSGIKKQQSRYRACRHGKPA